MLTRRELLGAVGASMVALPLAQSLQQEPLVEQSDLEFLRGLARATIASATRQEPIPHVGHPMVTPGGDYPAFWVRDFSMAAGCGLIPAKTLLEHLLLTCRAQNGPEPRGLDDGAVVPAFAIPDHVNFDGSAVFFPGTYSSGGDQGGEPWGVRPPVDSHYEFVHTAFCLLKQTGNADFLRCVVKDLDVYARLNRAMAAPVSDADSSLVLISKETRAVGFGFCDTVFMTGFNLVASLLRYRAMGEMEKLARAHGDAAKHDWTAGQARIRRHISETFLRDGWLVASTTSCTQPDVWGSALAVNLGVLSPQVERAVVTTLIDAYASGKLTREGAVRHVPVGMDHSPTTAWEATAGVPLDRYQNGAYWHVATGWLAAAIARRDRGLARRLVKDMVQHMRDQDFRRGQGFGAPWECLHPRGDYRQNPVYMASVTLPLEALSKLSAPRA